MPRADISQGADEAPANKKGKDLLLMLCGGELVAYQRGIDRSESKLTGDDSLADARRVCHVQEVKKLHLTSRRRIKMKTHLG